MDGRLVLPSTSADLKKVTLEEILNIPRSKDNEAEKTWVLYPNIPQLCPAMSDAGRHRRILLNDITFLVRPLSFFRPLYIPNNLRSPAVYDITNFAWFNLVSHPRELNTNDAVSGMPDMLSQARHHLHSF
ncbi:hypothetical protein B0H14DRAFT_2579403 [Mycena olivaceomarginata]|nr:hypothetical protein B0H14DRAFT_2579403 [Mycena olivaceomarginata]